MAQTEIAWGDPKAVQRYSSKLHMETMKQGYFTRKFTGKDDNNIIQEKTELTADAGDTISFDLSVELKGEPTFGDNTLDGKEEALRFYTDKLSIDQVRKAVSAGGRMSRKRTVHNMRSIGRRRAADYFKALLDSFFFIYLSGARGVNYSTKLSPAWAGFAQNPLLEPSRTHHLFGGVAESTAEITAADTMSRDLIERCGTHAEMLCEVDHDAVAMTPLSIEGGDHFVLLMNPWQLHDLRMKDLGATGWAEIQKALMSSEGRANPVIRGGSGMINDTVLHTHHNVRRFTNWGVGSDLPGARALFMGRQAGFIAFGSGSKSRVQYVEELKDYQNNPTLAGGYIMGVQKARFNGRDYGCTAVDTYAANPNPV